MEHGRFPSSDVELVQKARRGDLGSFHQLVDRHAPYLYGLACKMTGNTTDAEDVLQETLAGAFGGLTWFRGESSPRTWMTRILVRQAAAHLERSRRHRARTLRDDDRGVASSADGADARMDVQAAILSLEPEFRDAIVLREMQGLSYEQIAAELSIPRGTVESRLFRARRKLQHLLRAYLPNEGRA